MAIAMIQKIQLENFKGFKSLELDQLSRITLLGGENSVGKTSVLEAIFLFFDRGNAELVLRQFSWRGMSRLYLSPDQLFFPIFNGYDPKENIEITLTIDGRKERLRVSFSEKMEKKEATLHFRGKGNSTRVEDKPVIHGKLEFEYVPPSGMSERSSLIVTAKGLTLKDANTKPERRPAIYISPRQPSTPAEDAQRFGELDVRGGIADAVSFLKNLDGRVQGLSSIFYGDSAVIHADIGLPRKIPVPQLGEGLSFMLSMFLAMSAVKKGVILVDEIGTGIHHQLLPKFWEGVSAAADHFECQVIATTHSYECMQAAADGLRSLVAPRFSYIRLDREKTEIKPAVYSFPVLEAALDSGWEVR